MNKLLKEMSFAELEQQFPVTRGIETRTNGDKKILVPYKEIMVANYELPDIPISELCKKLDSPIIPHKVEMRIRIYEED